MASTGDEPSDLPTLQAGARINGAPSLRTQGRTFLRSQFEDLPATIGRSCRGDDFCIRLAPGRRSLSRFLSDAKRRAPARIPRHPPWQEATGSRGSGCPCDGMRKEQAAKPHGLEPDHRIRGCRRRIRR